jgi:hypothetical protein
MVIPSYSKQVESLTMDKTGKGWASPVNLIKKDRRVQTIRNMGFVSRTAKGILSERDAKTQCEYGESTKKALRSTA